MKSVLDEIDSIKKEVISMRETGNYSHHIVSRSRGRRSGESRMIEEDVEIEVIVHFPRQFEALRATYCANYDEFTQSVKYN